MNRGIKFRALTLEGNIINVIGKIEFFIDGRIIVNDEIPVKYLIQWTGLKDKNGVEIYEGDVMQQKFKMFSDDKKETIRTHVVEYKDDGFYGKNTPIKFSLMVKPPYVVIGNIHKNPDLLKDNNQ